MISGIHLAIVLDKNNSINTVKNNNIYSKITGIVGHLNFVCILDNRYNLNHSCFPNDIDIATEGEIWVKQL